MPHPNDAVQPQPPTLAPPPFVSHIKPQLLSRTSCLHAHTHVCQSAPHGIAPAHHLAGASGPTRHSQRLFHLFRKAVTGRRTMLATAPQTSQPAHCRAQCSATLAMAPPPAPPAAAPSTPSASPFSALESSCSLAAHTRRASSLSRPCRHGRPARTGTKTHRSQLRPACVELCACRHGVMRPGSQQPPAHSSPPPQVHPRHGPLRTHRRAGLARSAVFQVATAQVRRLQLRSCGRIHTGGGALAGGGGWRVGELAGVRPILSAAFGRGGLFHLISH